MDSFASHPRAPRGMRAPFVSVPGHRSTSHRLARVIAIGMLTFAAGAVRPAHLFAHPGLESADPAPNSVVSSVPRALRLRFTQRVELPLVTVRLSLAGGRGIQLGPPSYQAGSEAIVVVPVLGQLQPGAHTVSWQAAGADGHPVTGEFTFEIAPNATGLGPLASSAPGGPGEGARSHHDPAVFPEGGAFSVESPGYVLIRWLTFLGMTGITGAVAFRCLVLPLAERRHRAAVQPLRDPAARYATRVGLASIATLAVAAALRLGAQYYALHGSLAGEPISPLLRTAWGWGWILEVIAVAGGAAGLLLVARAGRPNRRRERTGWALVASALLGLAVSASLSGHAVSVSRVAPIAVASDAVHVLAAGGWIGGLLLVIAAGIPAALRLPASDRGPAVAALVNAFSPTALAFAGVLVVTGAFAAWLHVGAVEALWESAYGRTLLLKLGVLSLVLGTGAYNWLRVTPTLRSEEGARRLRRTGAAELAVGAVVLLITAVLVATSPPVGM